MGQAFKEVSGMGVGIMRLFGLKRVGERGVAKRQGVEGRQVDKDGEASNGGGDTKTDAGGTSKEESPKDAAKEPENETVENDIQSAGYDVGILSHGETRSGGHHGTPLINGDNAGDDGHISIGEIPHPQDGNVGMLPDAEKVTASTPGLLDDELDGEKAATTDDRESVASNMIHNSLSQKVQSIHESVHFHIPDTPPVLSVSMGLKVDNGTNPDDTRLPILVSAPDPDDDVEDSCDHALNTLQVLPRDSQPRSDSGPKPDDIRPSIVVQAPNPDNFSDPVSRKNRPEGLEDDMSPGDIRRSILVTALDPDGSAERISIEDAAPGLESYTNPDDTQPPIISLVPDTNDNSNNFYDRLPELSPNNPASIGPQDAEPQVQFRHNEGDPFSPTPIFHPHGRPVLPHTPVTETFHSRQHRTSRLPGNSLMKC
ncbi:hypothetical protein ACLOAV_008795 [Pseudogymnoascus australis]